MRKLSPLGGLSPARKSQEAGNVSIAVVVVVVIILAIIGYFYFNKGTGTGGAPVSSDTASLGGTVANQTVGTGDVAEKVAPETNPFKAATANTFSTVYQNPFSK